MTRLVLADDHPIVLAGLRNLIESEGDFELAGEATNGPAALKLICETSPDVALIDISLPELNGIMLSRRVMQTCPSVRVVILTMHEDRAYAKQALDAGVRGYVLKRSAAENLIPAIRAVVTGGLYLDPSIRTRIFDDAPKSAGLLPVGSQLTEREAEVLKLVALGFTSKEIAYRLEVSAKTIETYKARAVEKLGLTTRASLVSYAAGQGWLTNI
jgi:DNA-binding NarL/FixJ family response regulator